MSSPSFFLEWVVGFQLTLTLVVVGYDFALSCVLMDHTLIYTGCDIEFMPVHRCSCCIVGCAIQHWLQSYCDVN